MNDGSWSYAGRLEESSVNAAVIPRLSTVLLLITRLMNGGEQYKMGRPVEWAIGSGELGRGERALLGIGSKDVAALMRQLYQSELGTFLSRTLQHNGCHSSEFPN